MKLLGHYVYLLDRWKGVYLADVSDPTNPRAVGWSPADWGGPVVVRLVGKYAFVYGYFTEADGTTRYFVVIFDVSQPNNPVTLGGEVYLDERSLQESWIAHSSKILGNHAYGANGDTGLLEIFEITEIPQIDSIAFGGNEVVLKWRGGPGMRIQRAHSLIAPDWADVPESDGQSEMNLPAVTDQGFFRLVQR